MADKIYELSPIGKWETNDAPGVKQPFEEPQAVTLYSYGYTNEGRSRPTLVPPNTMRHIYPKIKFLTGAEVLHYPITPENLLEAAIEVMGLHRLDSGELVVRVLSYSSQPIYLQHGTPLVKISLVVPVRMRVDK